MIKLRKRNAIKYDLDFYLTKDELLYTLENIELSDAQRFMQGRTQEAYFEEDLDYNPNEKYN